MWRRSTRATGVVMLALALVGEEPPGEFRLFTAGVVDTTKGKFTFDTKAAASVLEAYKEHGVELMVDYDHASLAAIAIDPALAGKAAGWFELAVRDGELWAVNVRWTAPAAEALRRKEWRYMSPAFTHDDSGRITSVLNVALTNMPATRRLEPLMAASATAPEGGSNMDPSLISKAIDAIAAGDAETALEILKSMIASAAGGESGPPSSPDGAVDAPPVPPETMGGMPDEKQAAVAAAISRLTRLSGKDTLVAAVDEVEAWRASHLKLEAETAKLAKEREALELGKRKENAIALTKLGAETPHTTGLAKGKLCKRLLDEPLEEQSARVAAILASRGGKLPASPTVPGGESAGAGDAGGADEGDKEYRTPHGVVTLTAREREYCVQYGTKPEEYAANKAFRDASKRRAG